MTERPGPGTALGMNFTRLTYFASVALIVAACDPDSKEIGATVGDTDGMTTTAGGTSAEGGSTGGMSATTDEATTTADSGGGGETENSTGPTELEVCEDAVTEEQCDVANEGFTFCGWFDVGTYALDNEGACGDLKLDTGRCFADGWEDSGCFDYPATCADGVTRVFFQEVGLEVGAVELVSFQFEDICEAPAGFEPCVFVDDGMTQTWDPPECACACPQG